MTDLHHTTSPTHHDRDGHHDRGGRAGGEVCDALMVWVKTTKPRVIAQEIESTLWTMPPREEVARLDDLKGYLMRLPSEVDVLVTPLEFGATHALHFMPHGVRVVGWLDAGGYRHVAGLPAPDRSWLDEQAQRLGTTVPSMAPGRETGWMVERADVPILPRPTGT